MAASFTYPGVYITEKESGARAVPAAATSIAMFIGMADKGPFEKPTRVQALADFVRRFGETSKGEMADQVRQFFMNGGGDAYIMRIADGEQSAAITIEDGSGADSIRVEAFDPGVAGEQINIEVDYLTQQPNRTFNLTTYRRTQRPDGTFAREEERTHRGLSLDPNDPQFVDSVIANESTLVKVTSVTAAPAAGSIGGSSISGLLWNDTDATARDDIAALIDGTHNSFIIRLAGRTPVRAIVTPPADGTALETEMLNAIIAAYLAEGISVAAELSFHTNRGLASDANLGRVLEIRSTAGPVEISSAGTNDLAALLQLGTANGGIELDSYSRKRPAPTGLSSRNMSFAAGGRPQIAWVAPLYRLAATDPANVATLDFTDAATATNVAGIASGLTSAAARIAAGANAATPNSIGLLELVRQAVGELAASIGVAIGTNWAVSREAESLVIRASATRSAGSGAGLTLTSAPDDLAAANFPFNGASNVAAYVLGSNTIGSLQNSPAPGDDGNMPQLADYLAAFATIESDVEIFNMLVLPRADGQLDADRKNIWGAASNFASRQRAILFVDPENSWNDIDTAEVGAVTAKLGVDTRNSVIYWPKLKIAAPDAPKGRMVDPSGSMAGLYARTDTRFGTWRAPAGIEATLTGLLGLSALMSDPQNGRINPKALNAIRQFPSGFTSWGARMMVGADDTGNMDDKYVPVRRMMLFIENSLYRGLRFAVFRENAEPLWASIRLAAGSFMNGLMLQGAFASRTKSQAYFVLCDGTTTTPTDVNLGIVNVVVGFAPNKPSEFVHLVVTQMAGQVEV